MRRLPLCLVLILLATVAGAPAPSASASSRVHFGLTDDAWLLGGPGSLESRIAKLDTLGVSIMRFTVHWDQVASSKPATPTDPTDPAYDWTSDDEVLDGLHAHGIDVLLQLVGTPGWANGGRASNWAPSSATSFRAFATAAARHYPWVHKWLIWNEPNQARWLRPTTASVYTTRLLNPAYAAIHAAIPGARVAGGGTAPRAGIGGVSPVSWLLAMRRAHARLDAYAHNPYPLDPKRETPFGGACGHCMTITMATIEKLVTLVSRNFPTARIWLTEYGYQTYPPDRLLGVTPALQARYVGEGAYAAYRTPRVDMLIQFLYRDEPNLSRFQSGLVTLGDQPKPALAAFELPLAEIGRSGSRITLWGQLRAPGSGTVARIEQEASGRWRTIGKVQAGTGGFFRWTGTVQRGALVRLHAQTIFGAPLVIR